MSLETDLHARLKADEAIVAIATGGIHHLKRPQAKSLPCVVITRGSNDRGHDLGGGAGYAQPMIDLDCYAASYVIAKQLANAVRECLQGFRGTMGSTQVMSCLIGDETDLYVDPNDGSDAGIYHVALDATIAYRESVPSFS